MATSVKPAETKETPAQGIPQANTPNTAPTEPIVDDKDGVKVTSSEKSEAPAVEATVAPKEVMKKVVCLQDHTCTIGNDSIIVEKGKDYNLREDIAYALQARQIVMVK